MILDSVGTTTQSINIVSDSVRESWKRVNDRMEMGADEIETFPLILIVSMNLASISIKHKERDQRRVMQTIATNQANESVGKKVMFSPAAFSSVILLLCICVSNLERSIEMKIICEIARHIALIRQFCFAAPRNTTNKSAAVANRESNRQAKWYNKLTNRIGTCAAPAICRMRKLVIPPCIDTRYVAYLILTRDIYFVNNWRDANFRNLSGEVSMSFGARLKTLRISNKLTQREVSEKTGIAPRHYQDLEADNHKLGVNGLIALSNLFGVTVDYLLGNELEGKINQQPADYYNFAEKKTMVFVRMFSDMEQERVELFKALMEIDCIPVGLLSANASEEEHLQKIERKAVGESDYYMMVLSMQDSAYLPQITKTLEEEFRYAANLKKPCMILLRQPFVELESPNIARLTEFFKLKRPKIFLLEHWASLEELGKSACRSIAQLRLRRPPTGWMRGDEITKEQLLTEKALREKIEKLESRIRESNIK